MMNTKHATYSPEKRARIEAIVRAARAVARAQKKTARCGDTEAVNRK